MKPLLFIACAATLAACASDGNESASNRPISEKEKFALSGKVTGPPVDCVQIRNIESTDIVNQQTIIFRMRSGTDYRVDLPQRCPLLDESRAITYRVSTGQLCSVDTFTVVDLLAGINYGACGLGKFQPYQLPERSAQG